MKNHLTLRLLAAFLCLVTIFTVSCHKKNPATNFESGTPTIDNTPTTTAPATDPATPPEDDESDDPANGAEKIVTQTIKLYYTSEKVQDIATAHYEYCPEILLMDTDTLRSTFLDEVLNKKATFTYEETETTLTITRSNGAFCILDFVEDSMYFSDFDLFFAYSIGNMADLLEGTYLDADGNSFYFSRTESTEIAGLPVYIDLAGRNIPLDIYEGKKYIPFQTFNDIFLTPFYFNFVYNSKDLFFAENGSVDASLKNEYYSIEETERSAPLIEYTINELCLYLDLFYGLQDEHGVVVGFDTFLEHIGLWEDLTSPDAGVSGAAIASLTLGYLADKHSGLLKPSPYTGLSKLADPYKVDSSVLHYLQYSEDIAAARAEIMGTDIPGYQEIDNTAYITFDSFTFDPDRTNGYDENSAELIDTMGLIIYAHSQITRENSPIENVVLDISCNGGGALDAAIYIVAWMLGYCDLHMTNPITNSYATTSYKVDVNLDGVFDEKDTIADKNLYCITSPVSFSCGNLVPALLKESGKVTLLGGTSGGGACAVQFASTADGTIFQISSAHHLTVVSNGAYYTIDRGVEPHHYFGKFESYYEREGLTEFINSLM